MTERRIAIVIPSMTIEEYASHVGVSTETVSAWVHRGDLPTIKQEGQCHLIDIVNLVAQFTEESQQCRR